MSRATDAATDDRVATSSPLWPALAGLAATLFILGFAGWVHGRIVQAERDEIQHNLRAILDHKSEQILHWRADHLNHARRFAESAMVARRIQDYLADPATPGTRERLLNWLRVLEGADCTCHVALYDRQLAERLTLGPWPEAPGPRLRAHLEDALRDRGPDMTSLFRDQPRGPVYLDLTIPIPAPAASAAGHVGGDPIAVILVRLDAGHTLLPLVDAWPRLKPATEILMLERGGEGFEVLSGPEGQAPTAPGGGFLALTEEVPGTPWWLAVRVPESELRTAVWDQVQALLIATLALLAATLLGLAFIWRQDKASKLSQALAVQRERTRQFERLEYLLRMSPAVIYTVDPAEPTGATFVSARVEEVTGFAPEMFIRHPGFWVDLVHPEDVPLIANGLDTLFAHDSLTLDYRIRTRDGDYRWMRDSAVLVRDAHGEPAELVGSWLDITDYKTSESQLRLQAEILANSTEGVTVVGLDDLRLRYVNPCLEDMLGYAPGELVGREISLLNAEGEPSAAAITAALRASGGWRGEILNRRKDGSTLWSYVNIATCELPSLGQVAIAAQTDISLIKEADLRMRRSEAQLHALAARLQAVREQERTRLAREVHDVLGQLLTALTMDIAWLRRRLTQVDDAPLRAAMGDKLSDMGTLTAGMIRSVQEIASELRPSILDNLGLAAAIRFEAGRFQSRTEIPCAVELPAETPALDPDRVTGLFRILQELLTNVARHAGATRVAIRLAEDDAGITLEVADDGRGITREQLADPRSMGLLSMHERVREMGGEIAFDGGPGAGTRVMVRVPR